MSKNKILHNNSNYSIAGWAIASLEPLCPIGHLPYEGRRANCPLLFEFFVKIQLIIF